MKTPSKLLLLLIFYILSASVASASDKFYQCRADNDCTFIDVCATAVSVNKKYEDRAKKKFNKGSEACLTVVPPEFQTHKPVCRLNECLMAKMSLPLNKKECLSQQTDKERDYCLSNLAKINNDPAICNEMMNNKDECAYNVLSTLKREKALDVKHCNGLQVGKLRDTCNLNLAKQKRNAEICFKILDKDAQAKCLVSPSSRVNDAPYWIDLTSISCERAANNGYGTWADGCYKNLENPTVASCNNIKAITPWYHCIRDIALTTKDLEVCNLVSEREFPPNYPTRGYSVSACKKWVSQGGEYIISK